MAITKTYQKERETPNTVRFQEVTDDARPQTIYITKADLSTIGNPDQITVTIDAK